MLKHVGALVSIHISQHTVGTWSGRPYRPPRRNWSFEVRFENPQNMPPAAHGGGQYHPHGFPASVLGVNSLYTLRWPPAAVVDAGPAKCPAATPYPAFPLTYIFSGDRNQVFVVIPDTAWKGPNCEITIDQKC